MALLIASSGFAAPEGYVKFRKQVKEFLGDARPEVYVQTQELIIIIVGMKTMMRKFEYNKWIDTYTVKDIRKFEDSTKSLFHQEPSERLKEVIEIYEGTNTN
jgi:protein tyrosine phosphatase